MILPRITEHNLSNCGRGAESLRPLKDPDALHSMLLPPRLRLCKEQETAAFGDEKFESLAVVWRTLASLAIVYSYYVRYDIACIPLSSTHDSRSA